MFKTQQWADVCVIAASVVVVGFLVSHYSRQRQPAQDQGVQVGDVVEIDGVNFEASSTTVLLALHSECRFCTASMPFYQRLVQATATRPDIHIVAIGQEPVPRLREYLSSHGLGSVESVQTAGEGVPIRGTPTVVTVSRDRTVRGVWRGQLAASLEDELFTRLGLATGSGERSDR